LQSTSFFITLAVLVVVGVLLFGAGSAMLRSLQRAPSVPQWPKLLDDSLVDADVDLRRDMIERLSLVSSPWSRDVLSTALSEERDPQLRTLIEQSLSH
jgi:hypothetical protein